MAGKWSGGYLERSGVTCASIKSCHGIVLRIDGIKFHKGLTSEGSLLRLSSADLSIGLMLWKLLHSNLQWTHRAEMRGKNWKFTWSLEHNFQAWPLLTPCVGNQLCFTRGWTHSARCLENIIGIVAWVAEGWFRILYTVPQGDCRISCDFRMSFAEKRHSAEAALWQVWAYRDYLPIELVADLRCCCEYGDKAAIGCPRWFTWRAFKESKFKD